MTDKVIVLTTCGKFEDAEKLAQGLIEKRLAACVNVVSGVRSYYRWQGKIENDAEFLLIVKTARGLVDQLRLELEKVHPYELPELIVAPIIDGSPNYLAWLDREVAAEAPPPAAEGPTAV
ncbi:MAG: divalent-cation tolerance protein CutA [Bryobacterales bacterium]